MIAKAATARSPEIILLATVPSVISFDEVAQVALGLPEATEGERRGLRIWLVAGKTFAWERPFSKADIKRFGALTPPAGPILGVRVADLQDKEAVLAEKRRGFFTIAHFDGFAAVLIQLDVAAKKEVATALVDAWLSMAPPRLVVAYLKR